MNIGTLFLSAGLLLLGLGFLLTGITVLSVNLKQLGSRQFRQLATRFTSPTWKAMLFGLASGSLLQSTSAALVILASLICTGAMTVAQATGILTGFSVGNCMLVFIVSLDIRTAVLFIVGISALGMYFAKQDKAKIFFGAFFGLGLIFYGIEMMVDGVRPMRSHEWFVHAMQFSRNWSLLSIAVGALMGFVVQSSSAVTLVAIGLLKADMLTGGQAFLFMYGAAIGSTFVKILIGSTIKGSGRQLVRFVNVFNFIGAGTMIGLYYIEVFGRVPLVMAGLAKITGEIEVQAALAFLLMNLIPAATVIVFRGRVLSWLARSLPPTEEEDLSRLKYLSEVHPTDVATGLDLAMKEQSREISQVALFLGTARSGYCGPSLSARHDAFKMLCKEVEAAISSFLRMQMDHVSTIQHTFVQTRQTLVSQLGDAVYSAATAISAARSMESLKMLGEACLESVDFLLLYAAETFDADDQEQWNLMAELCGDRSAAMAELRVAHLRDNSASSLEERTCLLDLTMGVEKIVWLLNRMLTLELSNRQDRTTEGKMLAV